MIIPKLLINSQFLEELVSPIFVKSISGEYIYCNSAYSKLIGKPLDQILNQDPVALTPRDLKEILKSKNGEPHTASYAIPSHEDVVKISIKTWAIYDINHDITGFIGAALITCDQAVKIGSKYQKLTKREIEVYNLLFKGMHAKDIAKELGISRHTATDHIKSIYLKLEVHSKYEAILKMLPLLSPSEP